MNVPGEPDRRRSEMPHVRVKRFGARHAKKDAAEHQEARQSARKEIAKAVSRIERRHDARMLGDAVYSQHGHDDEPRQHDRAEGPSDARRALRLNGEQRDENEHRRRQHIRGEARRRLSEPFKRREHRNGRGDRPVAVDQRRAEQADRDDRRADLALHAEQRHQRQDAALAVIVDAHREADVFDAGDDEQRP